MSGRFPKPASPGRGDGSSFIKGFGQTNQLPEDAAEPSLEMPPTSTFRPEGELPVVSPRRQPKPVKIPMTYKHREVNYKRLKRISQVLEVSMGDLIDEALDAKFPDWEAEI